MNTFACILLLAAVVMAEPPQYRQARFRSQRQEVADSAAEAPYPAAGFRPAKEFNLPPRQQYSPPATTYGVPADSYGAPLNTYLTPQSEYGLPEDNTESVDATTEEVKNVGESKLENTKENLEEPKKDAEVINSAGSYYVLLPGSQLQRVQFQTENDIGNMAYTARLQYKNEDKAPVFVYTVLPQYQSAAYIQLYK